MDDKEDMKNIAIVFFALIIALIVVFGTWGAICWGLVNGVLYLWGMPTIFTYLQGLLLGFIITVVRFFIKIIS